MLLELFERKEESATGHNPLLALSRWVKCNNYHGVDPHTGGIPRVLIGRTQGYKGKYTIGDPAVSLRSAEASGMGYPADPG